MGQASHSIILRLLIMMMMIMTYFDRLTRRSVLSLTGTSSKESFLKFSIQMSETNLMQKINIERTIVFTYWVTKLTSMANFWRFKFWSLMYSFFFSFKAASTPRITCLATSSTSLCRTCGSLMQWFQDNYKDLPC